MQYITNIVMELYNSVTGATLPSKNSYSLKWLFSMLHENIYNNCNLVRYCNIEMNELCLLVTVVKKYYMKNRCIKEITCGSWM